MIKGEKKQDTLKKPIWKKWCFWVVMAAMFSAIIGISINRTRNTGGLSGKIYDHAETKNQSAAYTSKQTKTHIYDHAEIREITYDYEPEKIGEDYVDDYDDVIGEYSVIRAASTEVTDESLTDWYFNYVINDDNDFEWCMILYTDRNDHSGVYATEGQVKKNVFFKQDEQGNCILGDSSDSTVYYVPTDERTLLSSAVFVEQVKGTIQDVITGKDESIIDVIFQNGDLCVYVDFTKKNPSPLTWKELAFSRTTSLTDAILKLRDFDDLWKTITIDFGPIGHIKNDKINMAIEDYDIWWETVLSEGRDPDTEKDLRRYFMPENFKLK